MMSADRSPLSFPNAATTSAMCQAVRSTGSVGSSAKDPRAPRRQAFVFARVRASVSSVSTMPSCPASNTGSTRLHGRTSQVTGAGGSPYTVGLKLSVPGGRSVSLSLILLLSSVPKCSPSARHSCSWCSKDTDRDSST